MKKTFKVFALSALALMVASCAEDKSQWSIQLKVKDAAEGDQVKFTYYADQQVDTTVTITNGTANISSKFINPTFVLTSILPEGKEADVPEYYTVGLFINEGGEKLTVDTYRDSLYMSNVRGGMYERPSYDTIRVVNKMVLDLQKKYMLAISGQGEMTVEEVAAKMQEYGEIQKNAVLYFISENKDLFYSAYLLLYLAERLPLETVKGLYEGFSEELKNQEIGQNLKQVITILESNLSSGDQAIPFTVKDIDGKELSLSDYKGKWVLIDFWGSWCGPCRQSNPALVEMYKKYHKKGFEVIGLAVNDNTERLKKAIEDDGITWRNAILDEQTDEEAKSVAMKYNISAVPTRILVDPDGVVFASEKGASPDSVIDQKLKELFE